MATDEYITCNGQRLTALRVDVANVGPWVADLDFEADPDVSGAVEIRVGSLVLIGTVVSALSGTHLEQRKCRVVAGAGGWARELARKDYHNNAKIKARLVAEDAAREVGETLGDFTPAAERIGVHYVRSSGPASRVLEHVIGDGVPWWVDYAGRTCVGPRASQPLTVGGGVGGDAAAYDVLDYDPRARKLTFAITDPGVVQIGSVVAQSPLTSPQTIREFELHADHDSTRIVAWCGGAETERGRLAGLMRAIARRATDERLLGKYRYRVVTQRGDGRVELQAVRKDAGLPDLKPVHVWPGVAGAAAELATGAEVLVEFIEGDPQQPIVTHFAGVGAPGFVPVSLAFCGSTQAAARQGDLVQSGGVGTQITLIPVPGAPATPSVLPSTPYLVAFGTPTPTDPQPPLYGAISTGSPKVRV